MADPMADRLHLKPKHREILVALLREHLPGVEVWVYGSRINGRSHDGSDLDLVLRGPNLEEIPGGQVGDFEEAVRESHIPFLVEARDWARLPKWFHPEIERDYVVLLPLDNVPQKSWGLAKDAAPWQPAAMRELVNIVRGRSYRSSELKDNSETALVTLKSFHRGGGYRSDGIKPYVGPYNSEQIINPGEIVISQTDITQNGDVIGRPAIVPEHSTYKNLVASLDAAIVRNAARDRLDYRFLYYRLLAKDYVHHIGSRSTGTTVLHLSKDALPSFRFQLPPLPEQRGIARILGALDDKIEVNRRMNRTLEAMAQALFKDWFVDFGPVRAKMEGRAPYLPPEIWKLFPDRFVDSELGEIPEGWKAGHAEDEFEIIMGQSPPGHTYNDTGDGLPFFQGCSDFGFRYPENRKFCTAPNRVARSWDTLVSVRAPVGAINMAKEKCCIGRGVSALRSKSGASSYGYYAIQKLQIHMREYEHTGTVFGAIQRKQLAHLPLSLPPSEVVEKFERIVHPKDQMIRLRTSESVTLTALRDALLPKLISGAIRIRDAETFLEAVA